jgi:hypothetical protein
MDALFFQLCSILDNTHAANPKSVDIYPGEMTVDANPICCNRDDLVHLSMYRQLSSCPGQYKNCSIVIVEKEKLCSCPSVSIRSKLLTAPAVDLIPMSTGSFEIH